MPTFSIDGNVGSGKTSVLRYLEEHQYLLVDCEPVAKWSPLLDEMYSTGSGSFEFQVRVWLDRCWTQMPEVDADIVTERSAYFQTQVFMAANLALGNLTDREFGLLSEMYAKTNRASCPHGSIYLRTDPDACVRRMRARARTSEAEVTADYIRTLHDLHEQAYVAAASAGMRIVCIDAENKSIEAVAKEVHVALQALGCRVAPWLPSV